MDPRLELFCSPQGPEIFHPVIHHQEVWRPDPFDVPTIHAAARDLYWRLLDRIASQDVSGAGRILLLLGESGAGKTHLMRVLRNATHGRGAGYFSYMQMTLTAVDYGRYVLNNVIDSLDRPYLGPDGDGSGLIRLSNALIDDQQAIPASALRVLREGIFEPKRLAELVYKLADRLLDSPRLAGQDLGLIRALLFLQRSEPAIHTKVLAYLRCQELTDWDRQALGGIVPLTQPDDPTRLLRSLANLMRLCHRAAFIVCIDQLEGLEIAEEAATHRFRRIIQTVVELGEIPNAIVLISCLDDLYATLKQHLPVMLLDRIEKDPEPVRLEAQRTPVEIEQLIAARLAALYGEAGIRPDPSEPLHPFPADTPARLANRRTRHVIDWCRTQRERSLESGRAPIHQIAASVVGGAKPAAIEALWNDALAGEIRLPANPIERLELLATAIGQLAHELPGSILIRARVAGAHLEIALAPHGDAAPERLCCALCERSAQGGHLGHEIARLLTQAGAARPVALRSAEFPRSPRSKVARQIAAMIARGGRAVVISDADWRALAALPAFAAEHGRHVDFQRWRAAERPLSRLPALRQLLALDDLIDAATKAARSHTSAN